MKSGSPWRAGKLAEPSLPEKDEVGVAKPARQWHSPAPNRPVDIATISLRGYLLVRMIAVEGRGYVSPFVGLLAKGSILKYVERQQGK